MYLFNKIKAGGLSIPLTALFYELLKTDKPTSIIIDAFNDCNRGVYSHYYLSYLSNSCSEGRFGLYNKRTNLCLCIINKPLDGALGGWEDFIRFPVFGISHHEPLDAEVAFDIIHPFCNPAFLSNNVLWDDAANEVVVITPHGARLQMPARDFFSCFVKSISCSPDSEAFQNFCASTSTSFLMWEGLLFRRSGSRGVKE